MGVLTVFRIYREAAQRISCATLSARQQNSQPPQGDFTADHLHKKGPLSASADSIPTKYIRHTTQDSAPLKPMSL
jgi:hypothetical protein